MEVVRTGDANEPAAQILLLYQEEDDEDADDSGGRKRMDEWRNQCGEGRESARIRLVDLYWNRLLGRSRGRRGRGLALRSIQFFLKAVQYPGGLLKRTTSRRRAAERLDLTAQCRSTRCASPPLCTAKRYDKLGQLPRVLPAMLLLDINCAG